MKLWVPFVILAALMQSWRNAFQRKLSQKQVPTLGVTLARFILAPPMAALYLIILYQWQPEAGLPSFQLPVCAIMLVAAVSQIIATNLMVKVFELKNYAIGVGLAKSEAVIAAVLGVIWFSAPLTILGWVGVGVGGVAVFLLSGFDSVRSFSIKTALYGLGSGLCFALTSLWVREASLLLGLRFPFSAAWVLFVVLSLQTVLLMSWLLISQKETLKALFQEPTLMSLTSLASFLGSVGWFTAMSLEKVPLVKTLGQIEIFFTLLISYFWFREKLRRTDLLGLILIVIAAICVLLV